MRLGRDTGGAPVPLYFRGVMFWSSAIVIKRIGGVNHGVFWRKALWRRGRRAADSMEGECYKHSTDSYIMIT